MSDLVSRIIDRLKTMRPELSDSDAHHIERNIRAEFSGEQVYIRAERRKRDRQELTAEVRRRFNGRNARQIARVLGIGKTTVYRILQQEGLRA